MNHVFDGLPAGMLAAAHRGYSARYPENSLLAQEKALEAGCLIVECDVRRSADGVFFCQHDETLERLAGGDTSPAASLPWRQLSERLPNRPAALADSLYLIRNHGALLLLDLKITAPDDLRAMAELISVCGAVNNVIAGVREIRDIAILADAAPGLRFLGLLRDAGRLAEEFFNSGGHVIRLWEDALDKEGVPAVCGAERPFWVTAGGLVPDYSDVGGTTRERLERCALRGARAVLLNDVSLFGGAAAFNKEAACLS